VRVWRPDWPCRVVPTLAQQRHGAGDPTWRREGDHRVRRGLRTPEGPATLLVEARPADGEVRAEAWGSGADWALASVPDLLGAADSWEGFEPRHPVLAEVWRHHPHLRLGRSGLLMESLVPAIIEQKVTGQEAFAGFRRLVLRFGEPAPGPDPRADGTGQQVWLPPDAATLRTIPSWEWLRLHIDPARSRTIVTVARVADSLERLVALTPEEADRRMRTLPGVGVWTSAEVRVRTFGDPDAVSFGDYHVAKDVGWALTGAPFDDAAMEEFLEPYRPQRGRVPALVSAGRLHRPRHGPKMAPRTHLP
jgi:3-methyladenine DNA glycosylase/8-oxoguanine DNA glycosylase